MKNQGDKETNGIIKPITEWVIRKFPLSLQETRRTVNSFSTAIHTCMSPDEAVARLEAILAGRDADQEKVITQMIITQMGDSLGP